MGIETAHEPTESVHSSPKDPCDLRSDSFSENERFHILQASLTDGFCRGLDFGIDALTLHKDHLAPWRQKVFGRRNQLGKGRDCTSRYLTQGLSVGSILRARAINNDIGQAETTSFSVEPINSALHGLNQYELDIRPGDRKHQARQACTTSDVTNKTWSKQGSDKDTINDVP
tara:strand:+ start:2096 stop:2611 length:516 start_codon:yes stop_codon:yes gene_type:complete